MKATVRDAGAVVCRRLAARIREVAPNGVGRWDRTWDIVAEPSDAFLDRLHEWEARDTEETRAALTRAADELVRAWRNAVDEWEDVDARARDERAVHA